MKKKIRKIKKFIFSHQVESLVVLISLLVCIIGSIAISPLVIPFIVIFDLVFIYWNQIKDFCIDLYCKIFKKKRKIKEESKGEDMKKKKTRAKKNSTKKRRVLRIIAIVILSGIITMFVGAAIFWAYIVKHAPKFNAENLYKKEASVLYDKDGKVFAKLGSEFREKITYDELPEVLINAIVATEDSRFFEHNGFDLPRFTVASVKQVLKKVLGVGGTAGGASTLTMQISKNAFTSNEDKGIEGIIRKFTDIYVAMNEIEKKYTKEEILEFYVNSYCLGGNIYGVEQAALSYFGKHAKDLNLSEAAIIAGLFQAPNYYSPIYNPKNSTYRRKIVLSLMVRHGYITQEEADLANAIPVEELTVSNFSYSSGNKYQGFIDTVVSEVKKDTGLNPYTTPFEIYTTLDTAKQDVINDAMSGKTYAWENPVVNAGISVIDVKNGEIAAIGTGRDTSGIGLLNHATFENQTKRQIGSTAKPLFDYGPAIEYNNYSPAYTIIDERYTYSGGQPITNFDGKYQVIINARSALAGSRNVPALKVFQSVKNSNVLEFVQNLGLSPEVSGGSIHEAHSIGGYNGESPLTVSAAYAAFANGGMYNEPHSYRKLINRETGVEKEKEYVSRRAMKDSTAFIVFDMLVTTGQEAMRSYRNINGWKYGAKTGTSNFTEETKKANHLSSDAVNDFWCTGINDDYSISVWYGYDKIDKTYYSHFGQAPHIILLKTVASNIWSHSANIAKPDSVVSATVESYVPGEPKLPSKYTPSDFRFTDYFVKGSEPTEVSTRFTQLENPKNFKAKYNKSDKTVTLTWEKIPTEKNLDKDWLKDYYKSIYRNPDFLQDTINNQYSYAANGLGGIVYDVYEKVDGKLNFLFSTDKDEVTISLTPEGEDVTGKLNNSSTRTYLVKTSWKKYSACDSSGTMQSVDIK